MVGKAWQGKELVAEIAETLVCQAKVNQATEKRECSHSAGFLSFPYNLGQELGLHDSVIFIQDTFSLISLCKCPPWQTQVCLFGDSKYGQVTIN